MNRLLAPWLNRRINFPAIAANIFETSSSVECDWKVVLKVLGFALESTGLYQFLDVLAVEHIVLS